MGAKERALHAERNRMMFRSVNDRHSDAADNLVFAPELPFVCECADIECVERIALSMLQFLAIESEPNRYFVLRGHESPEVEDVVAERDGYLIVSVRGAGVAGVER